ncbi:MAG: DoxX family protein [Bacteroidota bacterium]|nr:DoxX family protein [Bacteroidota bacterium]|tara:strand:+ start:271 stop:645 length:375 start_codon:yes stop_codon:yes gene_type:complete
MKVTIIKSFLIIISSIFYVIVGIKHFIEPEYFLSIVPPYLPYHLELVYISGLFEILFGLLILFPKYRYYGAIGLILLLVAVFPANIYLAQSKEAQEAIGATQEIATWRLPIQGVLIWIAYYIRR